DPKGAAVGLRLAIAMGRFWMMRQHLFVGRKQYEAVLSHPGAQARTKERGTALNNVGVLTSHQGDYACAYAFHEEALAISLELADPQGRVLALGNLALLAAEQQDFETAQSQLTDCLALFQELEDKWGVGETLYNLGTVSQLKGEFKAARLLFEESLAVRRELG